MASWPGGLLSMLGTLYPIGHERSLYNYPRRISFFVHSPRSIFAFLFWNLSLGIIAILFTTFALILIVVLSYSVSECFTQVFFFAVNAYKVNQSWTWGSNCNPRFVSFRKRGWYFLPITNFLLTVEKKKRVSRDKVHLKLNMKKQVSCPARPRRIIVK